MYLHSAVVHFCLHYKHLCVFFGSLLLLCFLHFCSLDIEYLTLTQLQHTVTPINIQSASKHTIC